MVKLVNSHTGTKKRRASLGRQVRCGARLSRSVIATWLGAGLGLALGEGER